jgi:transcriptional regulator with XRE-family HTH domain
VNRGKVRMAVQVALKEAQLTLRQIATDAGVSYGALRGWAIGRRVPDPESRARLVAALRKHGDNLHKLAEELDRAAGEE